MKILIENAGAQKGFLILEQTGKLRIEAEGTVERDGVEVLQSIPIESNADPPKIREGKLVTKTEFEEALLLYYLNSFSEAAKHFEDVLKVNPEDRVAQLYRDRCQDRT
jgi:hypothetical protein